MAVCTAREIRDSENVFIGIGVPLLGGMLAKATHAPNATLFYECGSVGAERFRPSYTVSDTTHGDRPYYITTMTRTFSDIQRGYMDVAVIGAAQIDIYGNLNTTVVGDYNSPITRLPGSGGANDAGSSAKRIICMMALEKKRFLKRVNYITTPGFIDGPEGRKKAGILGGGPSVVITNKGIMRFDDKTKEMYLASVYPGVSVDDIKKEVSWELKVASDLNQVEPPKTQEIQMLRTFDSMGIILGETKKKITFEEWVKKYQESTEALWKLADIC